MANQESNISAPHLLGSLVKARQVSEAGNPKAETNQSRREAALMSFLKGKKKEEQ